MTGAVQNKKLALVKLKREKLRRSAKTNLYDFINYVKRDYHGNWHHRLIADKLQEFWESPTQKKLMLFVPPQHGKLLRKETPVLTNKGWKCHGDLKVGDYVYNDNGKAVKVLANTGVYEWDLVRVTFNCGYQIDCSPEHMWKVLIERDDKKGRVEEIHETKAILKQKNRRSPAIQINKPISNNNIELSIDPYVLGCWLGDGSSAHSGFTSNDEEVISEIRKRGVTVKKWGGKYDYGLMNMTSNLRDIGVLNNKHIPIEYLLSSYEQRKELLRGLLDTDGSVDKKGRVEFTQKKGKLAIDVLTLIRSLGYKTSIKEYDSKINGNKVGKKIRLFFSPEKNDHLFYIIRKQIRINNISTKPRKDKYRYFIKSIESIGKGYGNCIQVEGSVYLADRQLIPTHNSEIASRNFPAWVLGQSPNTKIAAASYSIDLARSFNRSIQRIIDSDDYRRVFPGTQLNSKNVSSDSKGSYLRNTEEFEIVGHNGAYKAVGVMGGLSGHPVDLAIIDDPVKDRLEADSKTYRQRVYDWYLNVLEARLRNTSKVVLIMTRWHEDDLAGRLLAEEQEEWTVIKLPAIKEKAKIDESGHYMPDLEGDPREVGEALWPEQHSIEKLLKTKRKSESVFDSLYQQNPSPPEGNKVKKSWFEYCHEKELPGGLVWDIWVDGAYTKVTANDPTGLMVAAYHAKTKKMYIKHAIAKYMEMPEFLKFIEEYAELHGYGNKSRVRFEPKASGKSMRQMVNNISNLAAIEIKTSLVSEGKEARIQVFAPKAHAGKVVLVEGNWNKPFVNQICSFPNAEHDEFVDLSGYAADHYFKVRRRTGIRRRN